MAKGSQLKKEILDKMLKIFPNSFLYNDGKELRICGQEDGNEIQVKVTLTAAKENVYSGQDNATPGLSVQENIINNQSIEHNIVEPTQEEKNNVKKLMETFGL